MWALEHPSAARTGRLFADTPAVLLAVLAVGAAASLVLVQLALLPPPTVGIVGLTAGHGALLATALAWARQPWETAALAAGLIGLAAVASGLGPFGLLAYLAPPLWICVLARGGRLAALGLRGPVGLKGVAAGLLVGTLLGGHLLVSASGTLGLQVRVPAMREALASLAYDVGANVLAAECFFRGALFTRAQRRWTFAAAVTLATAAYVLRYLVDPLLPMRVELVVGAVFYLALLGAINCWLLWWSESLVPGLLSALIFFTAYRAIGPS
jgi:hypothetical protein